MILVDYREGSKELVEPLQKAGLPAEIADLDSGDIAFLGRGEGGKSLMVGIEHKKLPDLLDSLRTNRLNEQAQRMHQEFDFRYLLIEGEINIDNDGRLMKRRGWKRDLLPMIGPSAAEAFKRVFVLHLMHGLVPIFSPDQRTSVKIIDFLYRMWGDTDLDQHGSHLGLYEPPAFGTPTQFEYTIRTLPRCGGKVAKAAQKRFGSIKEAVNASVDEWSKVVTEKTDPDGTVHARQLGMLSAAKIIHAITERH